MRPDEELEGGLIERFRTEVRQSPGKAAVLGLGAVLALVVWGPRVAAALRSDTAPDVPAEGRDSAASAPRRSNPGQIREEFLRIADRARELRALASPLDFEKPPDPFHAALSAVKTVTPDETDDEEALEGLRLTAVFSFPAGRRAVISGRVVREGDAIPPFRVERIEDRAVWLRSAQGSWRLDLEREEDR